MKCITQSRDDAQSFFHIRWEISIVVLTLVPFFNLSSILRPCFMRIKQQVVDQNAFMKDVVPHFFSFSKYTSFTRQISGWNFSRKGVGPDRGSYYHELFLRGRPHLVKFMKREVTGQTKVKLSGANNSGRKDDSSSIEPDFFELSKAYPLPDAISTAKRSNVVPTAGAIQQQFVPQARANQHRHSPAVENGYRSSNSPNMHPSSGHHYAHHYYNGYQQWAPSGASYSNYNPPRAHYYVQPIQVQGQEPSQYSEQERYSEHRLHDQHRSSFLFNAPPVSNSNSHDESSGTHYFGQQQGHHNQNALYSTSTSTAQQSDPDRDRHLNYHHHHHHRQQQQQQHRDNDHNHALGTTHETHDGSTCSDHEHPAEQQATLKDGNLEAGPGPAEQQNGIEMSPLPFRFQPPIGSRTRDFPLNHSHLHVPSFDEEQRTALVDILGTAVDRKSPSTTGDMENDGKDKDASDDDNSVDNDNEKGNTDASEDDGDADKFSSNGD